MRREISYDPFELEYSFKEKSRTQTPSFRELAKLPMEERHKILSESNLEVDPQETAEWDQII